MQILEAALAFAITMLVLSLTCSAFVEIVHRVFSMREDGLKYMIGQMFDQVLKKYFDQFKDKVPAYAGLELSAIRASFVERMSSNRTPMNAPRKEVPSDPPPAKSADQTATGTVPPATSSKPPSSETPAKSFADVLAMAKEFATKLIQSLYLWNGRDLSSMTSADFMERLGSTEFGTVIKTANEKIGTGAADTVDVVLKDIAQKFDGFGKEAAAYFEGRARLLSVCVAIVLAFAIRIDAVELFNTFLRDPNARNKVIEQTQAVTAQYKAANDAADALRKISTANPPPPEDVRKQVEALQKEWQATVESTRSTVKQYADLGLPIGWSKENETLKFWAPTCTLPDGTVRLVKKSTDCKPTKPADPQGAGSTAPSDGKPAGTPVANPVADPGGKPVVTPAQSGSAPDNTAKTPGEYVGIPGKVGCWTALKLAFSLLLGGLLVGLGAPFWYGAVTGLTNIRSIARDLLGSGGQTASAPAAAAQAAGAQPAAAAPAPANPDKPQPVTPVGAFTVSNAARS